MRDENYINIQGWMLNRLKLKGNKLLIYAIIYGFSQDKRSEYHGSMRYIADSLGITKGSAHNCIESLLEDELIVVSTHDTTNGNKYQAVQKLNAPVQKLNAPVQKLNASRSKIGTNNNNPINKLEDKECAPSGSPPSELTYEERRGTGGKMPRDFTNARRSEIGKPPLKPKRTQKQIDATGALLLAEYYKKQAYDAHGLTFFGHSEDLKSVKSANGKVQKMMKAFFRRCDMDKDKAHAVIDWFLNDEKGDREWTGYNPEHCFSVKTVTEYENDTVKTQEIQKAWTRAEFIESCKDSDSKAVQFIGEWADTIEPEYTTYDQWEDFKRANMANAEKLIQFEISEIENAYAKVEAQAERKGETPTLGWIYNQLIK